MAPMLENILRSSLKTPMQGSADEPEPLTILEIIEKAQRSGVKEVPQYLHVPEDRRPGRTHDEFGELPLIDLSISSSERVRLSQQVGDAATSWGAFQVVNHGVPPSILEHLDDHGKAFFARPVQEKLKLVKGVYDRAYYTGNNAEEKWHSLHWAESYVQLWNKSSDINHSIDAQADILYPDGSETYKLLISQYMEGIRATTELVLQLLAEHLGLDSSFFWKRYFPHGTSVTRWNYYPLCPAPDTTLGAHEHTDPNFITFLYQDNVGGLQVKKDEEWYGVRPIKGALIINIADTLHVLSNGYFKTVLHQVVVNESAHRLSLACSLYLENEADLSAPSELVNEKHPRLYKNIFSSDYWNLIFKKRESSLKSDGSALNGLNVLKDIRMPMSNKSG